MSASEKQLRRRVADAAQAQLAEHKCVAPVDVLAGIGWVHASNIRRWRQGRIARLDDILSVGQDGIAEALGLLREWASDAGLAASETDYVAATRDRCPLRFTHDGDDELERALRTHWVSAELSDAQRNRVRKQQSKAPDLVVVSPVKDGWTCWNCGGSGSLLFMEGPGPLCLTCADLDHLAYLPAGNTR